MKAFRKTYLVAPRGKFNPNDPVNAANGLGRGPLANVEFKKVDGWDLQVLPMGFVNYLVPFGAVVREVDASTLWRIDLQQVGFDPVSAPRVGGVIGGGDGLPLTRYLLWALFSEGGDTFEGFCATLKPILVSGTIDSGGTPNNTLVLDFTASTANRLERFTVGAWVTVRTSATGTAPNFQWQTGRVTDIEETSGGFLLSILLDDMDGATTLTGAGAEYTVEVWSNYQCWDGSDVRLQARVMGECITDDQGVRSYRSMHTEVYYSGAQAIGPGVVTATTLNVAASAQVHIHRHLPPWVRALNTTTEIAWTNWNEVELDIINTNPFSIPYFDNRTGTGNNRVYASLIDALTDYIYIVQVTPRRTPSGDLAISAHYIRTVWDGGLRE